MSTALNVAAQGAINGNGVVTVSKSVVRDLANLNSLHDMTPQMALAQSIPSLLTELVQPSETFLQTSTFEFDRTTYSQAMPSDKSYSERGLVIDARPVTKTHLFKVPSYGMQAAISHKDVLRRRKAGTKDDFDTVEAVVAEDMAAMRRGWALFNERALAYNIVTGKTYVPNGTVPEVDCYLEFTGVAATSRPSKAFLLNDPTAYPAEQGEDVRAMILDNLLEGQTVDGIVALCSKTFFRKRKQHVKEEQAMVDRSGIDNQDPLIQRLANFRQQYRQYRGADDILYIVYDAKINGQLLIPEGEAYFMPAGTVGLFMKAYAPAETKSYVNTVAQREYMWRGEDEFTGIQLMSESNFVNLLVNPNSIIKGTIAP